MVINIENETKANVLAALYNNSKIQGMGFLQATGTDMTIDEAQKELDESHDQYFDYLHGKVMKVNLKNDTFDTWLYDRDNGDGAALRALNGLKIEEIKE
jgi:hypothetical protein